MCSIITSLGSGDVPQAEVVALVVSPHAEDKWLLGGLSEGENLPHSGVQFLHQSGGLGKLFFSGLGKSVPHSKCFVICTSHHQAWTLGT